MLTRSYLPGVNPTRAACFILFARRWLGRAVLLSGASAPLFVTDAGLWVPLLVVSVSAVGVRVMLASGD